MQDDGSATPDRASDAIRLHDLPGYEMQKQKTLKNTLAASLDGRDANNILLYGDKGASPRPSRRLQTYADRGLKIIEMSAADQRISQAV